MSFSNHNRPQHPTLNYFQGSPYRQYGSGIGTAIKAGLKGFVIPMVKRYGIPVAKSFLQQAAPEVINLLDGNSKPKAAMKNAIKKTIRQQMDSGRRRRVSGVPRGKKGRYPKLKKKSKLKKKKSKQRRRKPLKKKKKLSLDSLIGRKPVRRRNTKSKKKAGKNFLLRQLIAPDHLFVCYDN